MLKDVSFGQYYPGSSFVHRMDPRVKLLVTIAYIVFIFLIDNFIGFIPMLAFLIASVVFARVPFGSVLKSIKGVLFVVVFAAVLNAFVWKPLDGETLAKYSKQCGCVVTAENHNIIGGLGSAVAGSLSRTAPAPIEMVGIEDQFGEVGTEAFLRERFDLTAAHIERAAKAAIARK